MKTGRISRSLAALVRDRADYRCEYCKTSEWLSGQRCHIDHIVPLSSGGVTDADNLCLACAACNSAKLDKMNGVDPETQESTRLFNPRTQNWHEHFRWSDDGVLIEGITSYGRASVAVLRLNRTLALSARSVWGSVGLHPPD